MTSSNHVCVNTVIEELSACEYSHCWANGAAHIEASIQEGERVADFDASRLRLIKHLGKIAFSTSLHYF